MRKFNQFLLFAVFSLTASVLCAQLNVQATRWAVPGKQVNFNNYPATASTLNTDEVLYGINSYTYMDGPMLFQITDNVIKSPSGSILATMVNPMDNMAPEVITCEIKNDCNSFITFYIARELYIAEMGLQTREKLCYSEYTRDPSVGTINMVSSGNVLKYEYGDAVGGIALSKERADGSRFLYYASTNPYNSEFKGFVIKYTIDDDGTIDGGTTIYSGVINKPFRMTELELSHDGSRLAFGRLGYGLENDEDMDVVIFELNTSTGNLANSTPHYVNLASNDEFDDYPGIEFSADGAELFVLEAGVGLYKIDMSDYSFVEIQNFDEDYTNSMLELGRDGYYYLAKADGLYRMNSTGTIYSFATGTMQINSLLGQLGCDAYVLPDQIDGQDYKTYSPSIDCCYEHNESPI
ncbi:MAG: hypothetical protein PHW83_13165, partial [Bacteroidales bacterium]|nr:hypothetical protein [Bacteroidales bacterium]